MSIEFNCTQCNQRLQIPPHAAVQPVRCPHCRHVQTIPLANQDEPQEAILVTTDDEQNNNPFREDVLDRLATAPTDSAANPYSAPLTSADYGMRFAEQWNLASRGKRLLGSILDWSVLVFSLVPGYACLAWSQGNGNQQVLSAIGIIVLFVSVGFMIGVFWWMAVATGQSPGKRILGMRVVRLHHDGIPGFVPGVLIRQWVFTTVVLSSFFCCPIGFLFYGIDSLMIFGERQQCLHDLLASTIVVNVLE